MTQVVRLNGIEGVTFEAAAIDRTHWNGWAIPHFTKAQADRVVAWFWKHGQDGTPRLRYDHDAACYIGTEDGEVTTYTRNVDGTYSLGAANWCWESHKLNPAVAGGELADALDGGAITDIAPLLTCKEAEALAQFFRAHDMFYSARVLIEAHEASDEAAEYDRH